MANTAPGGGSSGYSIKPNSVGPGGEEAYSYQAIMPMMHGLEPYKASGAGDAFINLAGKLDDIANKLKNTGDQLAANKSWRGSAATAAMEKFQQLHDQTAKLAAQSRQTGNTLHWLGNDVMPQYKAIPDPQVASGWEQALSTGVQATTTPGAIMELMGGGPNGSSKANSAAQDYLKTFNQHLATANNALPDNVTGPGNPQSNNGPWQTPPGGGPASTHGSPVTGYPPGGYSGGGPVGGGSGTPPYTPPGAYTPPGGGRAAPPKLPSGGGPTSTGTLQGYTPPPGGGTPSPFGGGSPGGMPGGGANPFSPLGTMPGGGPGAGEGGLPGGGGPGEGLAGESGLADGAAGDAAAADGAAAGEAAGAAGAEGAEGTGMAGMPMGGSGSGQQDKERQRQAWMHEDEDIWGVPKDDVGPVIG